MTPLFTGIQMGLLLTSMVGPIFFTLLQTGIERGIRAGLAVSFGELFSDMLYILTAYFGLKWLMQHVDKSQFQFYVGLLGGAILLLFGLVSIFSKMSPPVESKALNAKSLLGFFGKGFAINTFNPFTLIFWMGTTSSTVIAQHYSTIDAALFYGGTVGTIALFDVLKVWGAQTIRPYLKPNFLIWLRRATGIGLVIFGRALVWKVV